MSAKSNVALRHHKINVSKAINEIKKRAHELKVKSVSFISISSPLRSV